jgi:hypothetical protein
MCLPGLPLVSPSCKPLCLGREPKVRVTTPNVIDAVKFPFIEIFCCTCEWALQGNNYKHQIVVILTCIEDIIHYCGTWYGSHCGGLGHMFENP